MKAVALKRFSFSSDGLRVKEVQPGEVVDIPDALFAGLRSERFVDPHQKAPEAPRPPTPAPAAPIAPPALPAVEARPDNNVLHVRHLGRGKYAVYRGETRVTSNSLDRLGAEAAMADLAAAQVD